MKNKRVKRGLVKQTLLKNQDAPNSEIQEILAKNGYEATLFSIRSVRNQLQRKGILPYKKEFVRINPVTGDPLTQIQKAAKYLHYTHFTMLTVKELANLFGISENIAGKLFKTIIDKRWPKGGTGPNKTFSQIDPVTGEPIAITHRIRKAILKNPELSNIEIASQIEGTTPTVIAWERIRLRKRGFEVPKFKPGPRPKRRK